VHCLKRLDHPAFPKLHHYWHDELFHYIEIDYIEGGELLTLISSYGLPSLEYVRLLSLELLEAMEAMASKGIVHRDLKPENILLTRDKRLVIVDFGTARDLENPHIKGSGNGRPGKMVYEHFVGTPQYMPLEMIRNRGSDLKSDIWAFGIILY